jgi:hypothetical protein
MSPSPPRGRQDRSRGHSVVCRREA